MMTQKKKAARKAAHHTVSKALELLEEAETELKEALRR
jgi:hypothetical protein